MTTPSVTPARGGLTPERIRVGMLRTGAVLLPLGLLLILLGWYGTANTPYQYDQLSYVVSGGLLGLALTVTGGFLLFGSWLTTLSQQNREASEKLTEALAALAAAAAVVPAQTAPSRGVHAAPAGELEVGLVTAGKGSTVHRSDCALVGARPDLVPFTGDVATVPACRVCRPLDGDLGEPVRSSARARA